jgi:hypothetical protein
LLAASRAAWWGKQERRSFLKKRTKKLLFLRQRNDRGHGPCLTASAGIKVFCFFSSEKKSLPSSY